MQNPVKTFKLLDKNLILASRSPRRKDILKKVGLNFQTHPSGYEEKSIHDLSPAKLVEYHSYQKAKDISLKFTDKWILGADTIVVLKNEIIEKPKDRRDAIKQLKKLSNKKHKVITGFTLLNSANEKYVKENEETQVYFKKLPDELIKYYVDNYKYDDKAGSYAIQDFASIFIKKIEGSYHNVVGLPISKFFWCINKKL